MKCLYVAATLLFASTMLASAQNAAPAAQDAPPAAQDAPPAAKDVATAGDPVLGEKVFIKCKACHQIGETAHNAVGPELNGLIGRHTGSVPDYDYSAANKNSGLVWDEATFRDYIKNPKAKIPGTKMTFAGLSKESDINNLVAYLKQFGPDGKKK